MLPDIALGATIAAIIGALASLLSLIISKEQKTSEFRQAWIDGLREDLTNYATQINVIADISQVKYASHEKKVAALSNAYSSLNKANFSINLRLNRDEELSNEVMTCIAAFNGLAASEEGLTPDNLRDVEVGFIRASQDLLKYEWRRVKKGESSFIVTKYTAAAIIVIAPAALLYYYLNHDVQMALPAPAPPITQSTPRRQPQPNALPASPAPEKQSLDSNSH